MLIPTQEHRLPEWVTDKLVAILRDTADRLGISDNNRRNGHGFPFDPDLVIRPYDWDWDIEDGKPLRPNIEFGGVRIWWYKYLGRSMEADRALTLAEWIAWLKSLRAHVETWPSTVVAGRDDPT